MRVTPQSLPISQTQAPSAPSSSPCPENAEKKASEAESEWLRWPYPTTRKPWCKSNRVPLCLGYPVHRSLPPTRRSSSDESLVPGQVWTKATEKRRKVLREQAEHANHCQHRFEEPLFEITEEGDVLCAHDGRPVPDPHQTLAEKFYWMEVRFGGEGLVHEEETQEFFTPEGELALSRDFVHLERLMGDERMKAWESEIA